MLAFGVYVRALREGHRMTRTGIADELDVDATTLWRVEEGKQEPSGSLILNLVAAVHGSYDDARRLLADKNATDDEARLLAEQRLSSEKQAHNLVNSFTTDEISAIRAELASDPAFVDRILDATAREILRRQR